MRTRAVAIASDRSNAVGSVELECTPLGLLIVYQGVGAFQKGYAPGALTTGTEVMVPWTAVREAAVEGNRLALTVDEKLTPHHRLLLSAFTTGDPPSPRERRRQRLVVRLGTAAGMLVGGVLVAATAARISSDGGASLAVLLGFFAAGVVLFVGMVADHRLGREGLESDGARLAFVTELSAYVPSLAAVTGAATSPPLPSPVPAELPSFQMLLPRTTTAVVITMSAALIAAMLTANWLSRAPARADSEPISRPRAASPEAVVRPAAEPEPPSAAGLPSAPAATRVAASPPSAAVARALPAASSTSDAVTLSGGCTCKRPDSLLWQSGLPRLSTVLIDRRSKPHGAHPHLELEIGVVNNWNQSLPEVSLLVQFFERDPPPSSKREPTHARPLYFEGPLAPGQAIKWHVEARGNDFEVSGAASPMLDETGADAASTAVIVSELLKAIHRPIRLHGAMLLAYLGDPRAKEGALGLREALREEEAPYIDRLLWTQSDVRTCSVTVAPGGSPRAVRTCVFNGGAEPREHLALKVRALDKPFRYDTPVEPPPLVIAEHVWKLEGQLGPGQGALAQVLLATENPDGIAPEAFEAYADRQDVVF